MSVSLSPPTRLTSQPVQSSSKARQAPARPRLSRAQIAGAVLEQPLFKPCDAADFCGISEDRVTDSILTRPNLFPPRVRFARRHEWTQDEFVSVVLSLCSLSNKAARCVAARIGVSLLLWASFALSNCDVLTS